MKSPDYPNRLPDTQTPDHYQYYKYVQDLENRVDELETLRTLKSRYPKFQIKHFPLMGKIVTINQIYERYELCMVKGRLKCHILNALPETQK